ncbi:hypothetical protein DFH28DRAFT_1176160 [Melampsora americana]|nr:hypothetical protein DFH28DRAFT_1176160 [Melampsora americana]
MPPKSKNNSNPSVPQTTRIRRTKAQLAEDLKLAGEAGKGKPTPAAVKRSRLAAKARSQSVAEETTSGKSIRCRAGPALDRVDYETILAFLANPKFRKSLFGGGSQTKVSGLAMGPTAILNPLALKLNSAWNERHNSTKMQLTGKTLYARLKRYKAKYMHTKTFSKTTGNGLSAKDRARGIDSMTALYEYMCPCFKEMDVIFRDKGNVNPFGILDTGVSAANSSNEEVSDDSEDDTTDGHDHSFEEAHLPLNAAQDPTSLPHAKEGQEIPRFTSPDPEELEAYHEMLDSSNDQPNKSTAPNIDSSKDSLNKSNALKDPDVIGHPLSPEINDVDIDPESPGSIRIDLDHRVQTGKRSTKPASTIKNARANKKKRIDSKGSTAQELILDSSSEEDNIPKPSTSTSGPSSARTTIARRALDPLPSIDPSVVRGRDLKHPVATAMTLGNEAKLEMMRAAQQADLQAREAVLEWQKTQYFLEREDNEKKATASLRNERRAFCEKLVLGGKSVAEVEEFLRLVYPEDKDLPASST